MKLAESIFGYTESQHVPNVASITANAAKRRVIQSAVMNLRRGFAEPEAIEPDYVPFSRAYTALGFTEFKKAHAMIWFDSDGSVNVSLASKGIVFLACQQRPGARLLQWIHMAFAAPLPWQGRAEQVFAWGVPGS